MTDAGSKTDKREVRKNATRGEDALGGGDRNYRLLPCEIWWAVGFCTRLLGSRLRPAASGGIFCLSLPAHHHDVAGSGGGLFFLFLEPGRLHWLM